MDIIAPAEGGGGGGCHSPHDWLRTHQKKTHRKGVSGGVLTPNLNPVPSFSCHDDVKLIWNFDS